MDDVAQGLEPVNIPIVIDSACSEAQAALDQLETTYTYAPELQLPDGLVNSVTADGDEDGAGCDCAPGACGTAGSQCDCIDEHGCFYDEAGRMQLEAIPPRSALYECSASCGCGGSSRASVVQRGISQKCEIRWTKGKGFGLFAAQDITKGTFVCQYAGALISTAEARERWRRQKQGKEPNYILVLREHSQEQTLVTTIDPASIGNAGRFLNHACPPTANLIMLPVRATGTLVPMPALFAVRDIQAGEEMSWDYNDAGGESWFYGRGDRPGVSEVELKDRLPCLCGSSECRGWIPYDAAL